MGIDEIVKLFNQQEQQKVVKKYNELERMENIVRAKYEGGIHD